MTDLVTLLVKDAVEDAVSDKAIEIAKNLLRKGSTVEFVTETTGPDR